MCDDVAERLVVDVSSRVDGSESEGLIRLKVYDMKIYEVLRMTNLRNILKVTQEKIQTSSGENLSAWFINNLLNLDKKRGRKEEEKIQCYVS